MKWLNNTARDLSKGGKRKTIIDQIFIDKKKIPSPTDYLTMLKQRIRGSDIGKCKGFNFMSETEFLGLTNPSPASYSIQKQLTERRSPGWRIVKPKGPKTHWKPIKSSQPGVGTYETNMEKILPKSPRAAIGKDKLKSVLDGLVKSKRKIPGVGDYNINECYNKISRPMRTTRC